MKLNTNQQKDFNKKGKDSTPKPSNGTGQNDPDAYNKPLPTALVTPQPFGAYPSSLLSYPSDVVQLDIYNNQDYYFESILAATATSIQSNQVVVDLEKELQAVGYESGEFVVRTRLIRNYLGSANAAKLVVQEISTNRLEIRVVPAALPTDVINAATAGGQGEVPFGNLNIGFQTYFANEFFKFNKTAVLSYLYLFLDSTTTIEITDYVQDVYTISDWPYSIVFKVNEPLPPSVNVGDLVWIGQETNAPTTERVVVYPQQKPRNLVKIKGPNFDWIAKKGLTTTTDYLSWDELLGYNSGSLVNNIFSGSLLEGMSLNVDYTRFENFSKFSSVYERIKNFEYKIQLIESYQGTSASLASSNASSSYYVQSQVASTINKVNNIIGSFDGFEKYMYFESSSYVSNSFGEFLDVAWPKSNSTRPYTLYGSNTTQVENWLTGILESASLYDANNDYSLRKLIPTHITDEQSDVVDSFVNMLGHFFDIQYEYINQMTKTYDRQQKLTEGFAKELVFHIAQNLGVDFANGDNFQDLWSYTLGLNSSGSYDNNLRSTGEDRTRELWKRIINNLPLLLKAKGTERGIRALINCFGIPSTVLRIREFGGPEPDLDTVSRYKHDRYYYATKIGNNTTKYASLGVPWRSFGAGSSTPNGFSFRHKAGQLTNTAYPNTVMERVDSSGKMRIGIQVVSKSSGDYAELHLSDGASAYESLSLHIPSANSGSNLFDGRWMTYYVVRDVVGDSITFYAGHKAEYADQAIIYSASTKNYSAYATSWTGSFADNNLYFSAYQGASSISTWKTTLRNSNYYGSGSIQEIMLWTGSALGQVNLENLILNPTTYAGRNYENITYGGSTSSYSDLIYRLPLGTTNVKVNYNTTTISGSQPDQSPNPAATWWNPYGKIPDQYISVVETNYMAWPDIAGNRQISNKVRIDSVVNTSNQLYRNHSVQTSLQDNQPVDSPRLGVYLSPTDQLNEDIAEQFAGISLDDYIGSYSDIYEPRYADLDGLRREYTKKNVAKFNTQTYIRLLDHFNGSLFTMVKQMVPYRANLQTGLVIEPNVLDRSKVKTASKPSYEDEYLETSYKLPSTVDPLGDIDTIEPGSIDWPEVSPAAENVVIAEGSLTGDVYTISSQKGTDFSGISAAPAQPGIAEALEGETNVNVGAKNVDLIEGSQYDFYTWYGPFSDTSVYSGLGLVSNSAGFVYAPAVSSDYSNPFGTTVLNNTKSQTYVTTEFPYNYGADLLRGSGSQTSNLTNINFTGDYQNQPFASDFGAIFQSTTSAYWRINNISTLEYTGGSNSTGSVIIPLLPYQVNNEFVYKVSFQAASSGTLNYTITFGSGSNAYVRSGAVASGTSVVEQAKASNELLLIQIRAGSGAWGLKNLKVEIVNPLNAQIQDYQVGPLASIGQANQKYNGCKLTSPDFNEDSPDTIDGGPVITITEGPLYNLNVDPNQDGTYTFK